MSSFWTKYYLFVSRRTTLTVILWLVVTALLCIAAWNVNLNENIADFIKGDQKSDDAFEIYGAVKGADCYIALVDTKEGSQISTAIATVDLITEKLENRLRKEGIVMDIRSSLDFTSGDSVLSQFYDLKFMSFDSGAQEAIDKALASPENFRSRISSLKSKLFLPGSASALTLARNDPMGSYSADLSQLQKPTSSLSDLYTLIDGHFFTPDSNYAVVIGKSPYGSSETHDNGKLISIWEEEIKAVDSLNGTVTKLTGAPVIASENARVLKSDSILLVSVALILMLGIMIYAFRRWTRIVMIMISLAWAWIAAMAAVALIFDSVSIIVVAMASVVFGIAVNYPIHMIDHLSRSSDRCRAYAEIAAPLLTGNITTVAAFAVLILLDSPAMKALGVFGTVMLAAAIVFTLGILPVCIKKTRNAEKNYAPLLDRMSNIRIPSKLSRGVAVTILSLTLIFAFFSIDSRFDSEMSHINYLSESQEDILSKVNIDKNSASDSAVTIAFIGKDYMGAVDKFHSSGITNILTPFCVDSMDVLGLASVFPSSDSLKAAYLRRHTYLSAKGPDIDSLLLSSEKSLGLSSSFFQPFKSHLEKSDISVDSLNALISGPFSNNFIPLDNGSRKAFVISFNAKDPEKLQSVLSSSVPEAIVLDNRNLISGMAEGLSDNFNFVGWACSLIVFFFLWISFRNLKYAIAAFMPMVLAWVWILGIMRIAGIEFNIVTIILATFIFGQGDDYTIFITDGLINRKKGRDFLPGYRRGILISALMMFAGMGVLLLAGHPALRSLGEVTVIGMASVLLMSWIIPPVMFRLLRA